MNRAATRTWRLLPAVGLLLGAAMTTDARADAFGLPPGNYAITFDFDFDSDGSIEGSGYFTIGPDQITAFDVSFPFGVNFPYPDVSLQCTVCDTLTFTPDVVLQNIALQFVIQDATPEAFTLGMLSSGFLLHSIDRDIEFFGVWAATPANPVAEPGSMALLLSGLGAAGWGWRRRTL